MSDSTVIRVGDVLTQVAPAGHVITDAELSAVCPGCTMPGALDRCTIGQVAAETRYSCPDCGTVLVAVGQPDKPGAPPSPVKGYKLGGFVIRNACDLRFTPKGQQPSDIIFCIPAVFK